MVQAWQHSTLLSILIGIFLFLIIFIPLVFHHYRAFGSFNMRRMIGSAAVSIYAVSIFIFTLIPIPHPSMMDCSKGYSINVIPGQGIIDFLRDTEGMALGQRLVSPYFLHMPFNIVLFIPLGLFLVGYFRWPRRFAIVAGFTLSVFVELTQGTGLYGYLPCPHRFADVDDIILNTLGAGLGAFAAAPLKLFFPSARVLRAKREMPRPLRRSRRIAGMALDGIYVMSVEIGLHLLAIGLIVGYERVVLLKSMNQIHPDLPAGSRAFFILIAALTVFYIPALCGRGASLGQRSVWLTWDKEDAAPSLMRRVWRTSVSAGFISIMRMLLAIPHPFFDEFFNPARITVDSASGWIVLAFISAFIAVFVTNPPRGLSGKLAGLQLIDSRWYQEVTNDQLAPDVTM